MAALGGPGGGAGGGGLRDPGYRMATEESWLRKAPEHTSPVRDYLAFGVGNEEYGVDIERLREIIKVRPVTEVPHAPTFVLGVIAVRGVVLPVIDMHRRLRLAADGMSRAARFLVVRRGEEELFGLLVDEVRQVVRLSDAEIEPPPPMLSGSEADFVSGIGRSRGRMVILLNLDQVLRFEIRRRGIERGGFDARRAERGDRPDRGDRADRGDPRDRGGAADRGEEPRR